MAHYYVERVEDSAGKLLGWAVFNAAGGRVAGPFGTEAQAHDEALRLDSLDIAREVARADIQRLAVELQTEAKERAEGHFIGKLLGMNEHYLLISAGRPPAHIVLRAPAEDAGVELEIGELMDFQIRNGEIIPQRPRSRSRARAR